jgi:hypothetical protein
MGQAAWFRMPSERKDAQNTGRIGGPVGPGRVFLLLSFFYFGAIGWGKRRASHVGPGIDYFANHRFLGPCPKGLGLVEKAIIWDFSLSLLGPSDDQGF